MNAIPKTVMLILTEQCNLRCTYCYEKHTCDHEMSFDTACSILTHELTEDDGSDNVSIDFFGGEPFLEFTLIKQLCEFLWERDWPKSYMCFASTNGTLINDEMQIWLQANKNRFICGLSFDGSQRMQDTNRSNSYSLVDLSFFHDTWPEQDIKMTISKASLPHLAEGIVFLHNNGFPVSCNFAYGEDWTDPQLLVILEGELQKLIDYYLENPNISVCSMLSQDMVQVGNSELSGTLQKWCGTGTYMRAYDCNGVSYPCQMFMPFVLGYEKRFDNYRELSQESIPISMLNPQCQSCVAQQWCSTCYGINFMRSGSIFSKDTSTCNLMKSTFIASSFLAYQRYIAGSYADLSEEDKYYFLKGVEKWQALSIDERG